MNKFCQIREMKSDDLMMVLRWRNHPDIRRFMFKQHEISIDEHVNWFEHAKIDNTRRLLIVEEGDLPIGYVQFSKLNESRVADWGFYICPEAPKGSGRKLGLVALEYAFSILNLHKVCGQALDFNASSIAFHQRLGFKQEGVLREHHLHDGHYISIVCFGLLKSEWKFN